MYSILNAAEEWDQYYTTYDPETEKLLGGLEEIYAENPGVSSYALKAKNIEYICNNGSVHLFKNSPFFFEFSSGRGRHTWGGLQSPVGSFLHNKTASLWLDPYAAEMSGDIQDGRIHCWNNPVGVDHFSLGYDNILEKGFLGILEEAETACRNSADESSRSFLTALIRSVRALLRLAERFSQKARERAEHASDSAEKAHFEQIARTAARVPANPPETFSEALASIVFCREAIGSLEGIGVSIYGHLDRILEPYYKADVQAGRMTKETAKNWFHLLLTYTDVRFETKKLFAETSTTLVIGGCGKDGSVCCNDLTFAMLETVQEGRYVNTKVNCRVSSEHPKAYLQKIAEVQAANIPILVVQNDDVLIPARIKCGFSEEDARSYVSGGCHEITLQNTEVCTRADTWINLPRLLLDVLEKSQANAFEQFRSEVLAEIKAYLLHVMQVKNKYEKMWSRFDPLPLASASMTGCLESGKDITAGGTRYATTALSLVAPATLTDSLLAIKALVYEAKQLTLSEFARICRHDFAEQEPLRKQIIRFLPKYGVHNPEADAFATELLRDIAKLYRDENGSLYKNGRGGDYLPAFYPHEMFRVLGLKTIATPDGRRAYTSLSRGCSPSEFLETDSPVAILQSLDPIDFTDYADSFCVEITLQRMDEEKGAHVVEALLEVFLKNRGSSIQFNFFDRAMLLNAQQKPEEYRNLCVRVCGYSAVFVTLCKEVQDEIIARAIR